MAWVESLGFGSSNQFVLDIGFHSHEAVVHGVGGRFVDTRQRTAHQVLGERPQIPQSRRGLFSEIETVGAAVGRIVPALDEAGGGSVARV
jgi:hypothetical protein